MLGVRAPIAAAPFARLVIEPAVAFARGGERRALHVALPPTLMPADGPNRRCATPASPTRTTRSHAPRRIRAGARAARALPAGWSWAALDGARVDEAHAALVEIFRDAPSTNLRPLEEFRQSVVSGASRGTSCWTAIASPAWSRSCCTARAARPGRGSRSSGRVPAYRGRGIGPRLVARRCACCARAARAMSISTSRPPTSGRWICIAASRSRSSRARRSSRSRSRGPGGRGVPAAQRVGDDGGLVAPAARLVAQPGGDRGSGLGRFPHRLPLEAERDARLALLAGDAAQRRLDAVGERLAERAADAGLCASMISAATTAASTSGEGRSMG